MPRGAIEKLETTSAKERLAATARRASLLLERLRALPAQEALRILIHEEFKDEISLVSSFGAESAVLLHMVAQIDPSTPVIFMDTGKLFGETRRYRKKLPERLGLTDVRTVRPDPVRLKEIDPQGVLWNSDANMCCWVRKVEPMQRALEGWGAWISGRKRFQSSTRKSLEVIEAESTRIKVNPLAYWSKQDIEDYFERFDLPRHPLVTDGYLSIGCMPCTSPVNKGEDQRSGRWQGKEKVECGIHFIGQGAPAQLERPLTAFVERTFTGDALKSDAAPVPLPLAGKRQVATPLAQSVLVAERADRYGHKSGVLWMTGIPAIGKDSLAMALQRQLFDEGALVFTLNEGNVRQVLKDDYEFSTEERHENIQGRNIQPIAEIAKLFADAGHIVLVTVRSPLQKDRDQARKIVGNSFHEVYLKADARDRASKDYVQGGLEGLCQKAPAGEADRFTSLLPAYEEPVAAEVVIDALTNSLDQSLAVLKSYVDDRFKRTSVSAVCSF